MENGYVALREIEKLCKTDIRYMWLLDDMLAPTFATIGNFIRDCPYKKECCPKAKNNRTIKLNRELTSMHEEVLKNLCSIHGALLCMNRSIQAEGTYDVIKWDKSYKRLRRKGFEKVLLEFTL